jgi:hypothetical protein
LAGNTAIGTERDDEVSDGASQCDVVGLISLVKLWDAQLTYNKDNGSTFDQVTAEALFDDPLSGVNAV